MTSRPGVRLTKVGQRLARLPIDPRLGRMILEAERLGCLRDVLVIAAALSIQDPRERPEEQRAQADQQHARFKHESSDFLTWLNLWRHIKQQQRELSSSAFRRMCKREHLNYLRIREWQDYESQLRQVGKEMKLDVGPPVGHPRRGRHPPGAALRPAQPHRRARGAREGQAGRAAPDAGVPRCPQRPLRGLPRQRAEGPQPRLPDERRAGRDLAPVGPAERRHQGRVGRAPRRPPGQADLLGAALVAQARGGDGPRAGHAVRRPAGRRPPRAVRPDRRAARPRALHPARPRPAGVGLPAPVPRREHRASSRRPRSSSTGPDAATSSSTRRRSSTSTTPASGPTSSAAQHFDQWWKRERQKQPDLLTFDPEMLTHATRRARCAPHDFPTSWHDSDEAGLTFPISYHFEPGAADDGLTIDVPVATLNRIEADDFSWLVPGLREELVTELIRSPAQEPPRHYRARTQHRPRVPRRDAAGGRAAARRPRAVPRGAPGASSSRARRGTGPRSPPTCDRPTGCDREGRRGRVAARTSTRSRSRCGPPSSRRWPTSRPTPA